MLEQNLSSLEKKIGQLFFIGIPGPEIDEPTSALLDEVSPGGVCLFARNIRSREQTRGLLDSLFDRLARPLLSVDEEGGLVDRLKRILPAMPTAAKLRNRADAGDQGRLIGEALRLLGFNMNFAPVVDVMNPTRGTPSNGLYSRTFGSTPESTAEFAEAFIGGLRNQGVLDCVKHFPGLGASRVDSHEELPLVEVSPEELDEVDLLPYRRLLPRTSAVMVGHAAFPGNPSQEKDADGRLLPSSLSYSFVTTLLREHLGFDGVVVTDDLEMGAITRNYGIGEAAKMAVSAGADMLAICADPDNIRAAFAALRGAVATGEIAASRIDRSVNRIVAIKSSMGERAGFDEARLESLAAEMTDFADRINF